MMKYSTRIYYTEKQKSVMWERWQKGASDWIGHDDPLPVFASTALGQWRWFAESRQRF